MSIYGDRAYAAFFKGYNCCQSVAVAFAEEMGMTEKQALQISAGFGGGFGRMREVCGAFSGITLVLGALYGSDDPAKKTALYTDVQALAAEYKARNGRGSMICKELLGLKEPEGSPIASPQLLGLDPDFKPQPPEPRTEGYYKKRPCPELCRLAADIMAEYIAAHPK